MNLPAIRHSIRSGIRTARLWAGGHAFIMTANLVGGSVLATMMSKTGDANLLDSLLLLANGASACSSWHWTKRQLARAAKLESVDEELDSYPDEIPAARYAGILKTVGRNYPGFDADIIKELTKQ